MKRSRTTMLLIGLTALALSAGVVAGMLAARLPAAGAAETVGLPPPPGYDRTLADELDLNADQRARMRDIWEGVRSSVHRTFDDAQKLQIKRDDELFALMTTEEQKQEAARISKKYADRYADLSRERDRMFDKAVERTNGILSAEQQKKYAEIRKTIRRPATRPAELPTTRQATD